LFGSRGGWSRSRGNGRSWSRGDGRSWSRGSREFASNRIVDRSSSKRGDVANRNRYIHKIRQPANNVCNLRDNLESHRLFAVLRELLKRHSKYASPHPRDPWLEADVFQKLAALRVCESQISNRNTVVCSELQQIEDLLMALSAYFFGTQFRSRRRNRNRRRIRRKDPLFLGRRNNNWSCRSCRGCRGCRYSCSLDCRLFRSGCLGCQIEPGACARNYWSRGWSRGGFSGSRGDGRSWSRGGFSGSRSRGWNGGDGRSWSRGYRCRWSSPVFFGCSDFWNVKR
jgi:hypothetical protein